MPYMSTEDLPETVRTHLPYYAQRIYVKAFNSAWDDHQKPTSRRTNERREEVAHKVAWNAVKQKYHRDDDGTWHTRTGGIFKHAKRRFFARPLDSR